MKRSSFVGLTLSLIGIEIAYSIAHLNNIHHFFSGALQDKYFILFVLSYIGTVMFSAGYFVFSMPSFEYKRSMKEHFDTVYGRKSFNFLYSYHFLVFAAVSFYGDAWPYFIMGTALWVFWNWVRHKQNTYADEYELERKKEEAKHKPTVVLDSTDLL